MGCLGEGWLAGSLAEHRDAHQHAQRANSERADQSESLALQSAVLRATANAPLPSSRYLAGQIPA
jgi:hypothetical protein